MSEINPNHPVTILTRDQWHKILAVMMAKLNMKEFEIHAEDVALLGDNERCVVADCRGGRFVIRLMSMAEGEALARGEGGLPV